MGYYFLLKMKIEEQKSGNLEDFIFDDILIDI